MKQTLTVLTALLVCCVMMASVEATAAKEKARVGKPRLSARHKQTVDPDSKEVVHQVSVTLTNGGSSTGTVYAIYKLKSGGGRYTCLSEPLKEPAAAKKGKKGKKAADKKKKTKKDAKIVREFTFPHRLGDDTFYDYLIVVRNGDEVVASKASSSIWARLDDMSGIVSGEVFDSKGQPIEDETAEEDGKEEVVKENVEKKKGKKRKKAEEPQPAEQE